MNKKRIIAVILIVIVCLSGCLPEDRWPHKVTFDGHEDLYEYDKDKTDYYQGKKLALLYDDNTAEYTKLGSIGQGADEKKEIAAKLKKPGDIDVEFIVDYTE